MLVQADRGCFNCFIKRYWKSILNAFSWSRLNVAASVERVKAPRTRIMNRISVMAALRWLSYGHRDYYTAILIILWMLLKKVVCRLGDPTVETDWGLVEERQMLSIYYSLDSKEWLQQHIGDIWRWSQIHISWLSIIFTLSTSLIMFPTAYCRRLKLIPLL